MALGKGIPVINGFDLNSKLPLDSRTVADTMEDMNALTTNGSVGDGQICYCKADKKLYVLKDNVWSEVGGGGGSISVIELTDKNGTIASTQLSKINANPQNFAFKYNGKILLFTKADSTTYQYCNNTTSSSENNVMTTSTLLTITSSTGAYTIAENVHNVVANSIHPANGGDLTNIQVGSKVYSIPSGGELTGEAIMNATKDSTTITRALDTDGKVKFDAKSGGESIPVVEGTITTEDTFALNETPTGDYFLAHLLYAGFVYVNSLMTKTTVTFGETNIIFYIGLIVLNGVPFLAYSATSEDGNSVNNVMNQICFMNNPYQNNGIIYFTNGGFDSLEYGASGTYLKSTGDGVVWDTPSASGSGSISVTFED